MGTAVNLVKFLFTIFVIYFIPGCLIVRLIKGRSRGSWSDFVVALCSGIFAVPQIYYYLSNTTARNYFLTSVIVISYIYIARVLIRRLSQDKGATFPKFKIILNTERVLFIGLIALVLLFTMLFLSTSGTVHDDGMRFYQANAFDSVADLAMVGELSKDPPHESPFYAGIPFKGFHIGSFYWRAIVQRLTGIDAVDLFFRYCPLFLFPLIVSMVFIAVKSVFKKNAVALLAAFFIFLMGDLSWIFPLIDRLLPFKDIKTIAFQGGLLWDFLFNPPVAHALMIFFLGSYLLNGLKERENCFRPWAGILFLGFLFGALFEYKVYICAVSLAALFTVSFKEYFFRRYSGFLKISLISLIFFCISFFRMSSNQGVSLFRLKIGLVPLSIFREAGMVNIGESAGIFIMLLAFFYYLIGALGLKTVGFYTIYEYLRYKKSSPVILFFIFAMAFSFVLANSLALSSDFSHGTYDFISIFLVLICVFAAAFIISRTEDLKKSLKAAIFFSIVIIGIGSTLFSFLAFFPKYSKYKAVSMNILDAAEYIRRYTGEKDVLVHNKNAFPLPWIPLEGDRKIKPDDKGRDSFITALTQRRTVCECSWHMEMCRISYELEERERDISLLFNTTDRSTAKKILNKYLIKYIWVEEKENLRFNKDGFLKEVYSNPEVRIYKKI